MVTIVNYGLGNVEAISNIYRRLGLRAFIATNADELRRAERIILPGVGAFDWAMDRLEQSGMRECLDEMVLRQCRPVLGICVGMQMMARGSEEGIRKGLGWINANVRRFGSGPNQEPMPLPHMGWNDVSPLSTSCLFKGLDDKPRFYFLHSFFFEPCEDGVVLGLTEYTHRYASAVRLRNIFGVQFHPEKSHGWGIALLKNFAEIN